MPLTSVLSTAPAELDLPQQDEQTQVESPWVTIVWNDPVNLMSYVTFVFGEYFHYSSARCEQLMLQVHTEGRAVVSSGTRDAMERDTEAMQGYGLWATFQQDS